MAAHLALRLGHVPRGGGGQLLAPRLGGVLRVGAAAVSVGLDTAAHREESSSIVTSIYLHYTCTQYSEDQFSRYLLFKLPVRKGFASISGGKIAYIIYPLQILKL